MLFRMMPGLKFVSLFSLLAVGACLIADEKPKPPSGLRWKMHLRVI